MKQQDKHAQNEASYRRMRSTIDQRYAPGRFVAIDDGQVIADAESFEELRRRIQATGKVAADTFVVQAGADYPQQVVIFLSR